jgi:GNAT superfamily N-acetyltransferase
LALDVIPLAPKHLEDATKLVSRRYAALHEQVPALPARYGDAGTLLPLLDDIASSGSGVAAVRGEQLVGFLAAWTIPSFRGKRTAFSPEWANGALPADSQRIYERMYAHLAALWVAGGSLTHLISTLANDHEGIEGWHWLGFGMLAADAVRDLSPVEGEPAETEVRRARSQDADQVQTLEQALRQHLAASPVFLVDTVDRQPEGNAVWLEDPDRPVWLAYCDGTPVAYIGIGPASEDASTIIRDARTASITGAFTKPAARSKGIGTALLDETLAWARANGYVRCAVDFEPMNSLAARFWLRHFRPVCYTLVRHVDERASSRRKAT